MINSYDIETFVNINKKIVPYCICFLFKKKYFSLYYNKDTDIIIDSLNLIFSLNLNLKQTFYIHNLNFDGILILSSLSINNTYKFESFIRDNSIYSIKIYNNNNIIEFKCSYKILPISLKKIANTFKINSKLIFPYKFSSEENLNYSGETPNMNFFNNIQDYNVFQELNRNKFNFKDYSIKYCKRDVEIVCLFIENLNKILKDIKIDLTKSYSAPSLSLKIFREKFNKKKVKISQNNFIDKHIRNSYFGGRCEVYGNPLHDDNIYHFDFSGMYSQCMLEKFCYGRYKINTNSKEIKNPGFYYIEYSSNMEIPVLPHHNLVNHKLLFTNGEMVGIYWFEEILLFIEMGGLIKKIHYCIEFEHYDYIFNDFIEYFNKIKDKGDDYKTFGKLMINSLYGRLGMKEETNYSLFVNKENFDYCSRNYKILNFIQVNDFYLIKLEICEKFRRKYKIQKSKNNICIASSITSKARIKLYKAQQSVIKNEGRLLYSDTDSIFASYKRNVLGEKHGDIYWDPNKDDTEIKDAVFVNPKTYGILYKKNNKEIIRMKGYNNDQIKFSQLKEKFYAEEIIRIEDFLYLKKSNFYLENIIIEKIFDLDNYDKRVFIENKKNTKPLFYENFIYF
jgi:hypothetical protein